MWHSAPTGITIDLIRGIRTASAHGRTILVDDEHQIAALAEGSEKQCKANRTGNILNAEAIYATNEDLEKRIILDGGFTYP